ncbi:hypothetical protein HMPREF9080_00042 [Cardiobacterium valvarum F0432]|uniref:Uncharacterized protein n=1 Tax=Cardiobacterium valvarum F0432 TaxID=797473 RepID=G9ZBB9_9GAMM|nr:hypothetical protein HMPREF9080_00042 [Cardiobacterium valvarum F0432]
MGGGKQQGSKGEGEYIFHKQLLWKLFQTTRIILACNLPNQHQ